MSADSHDLLEAFKAAALSVTKLYKTTGPAIAKARSEGYQDCLDDLLAFLDRSRLGLSDGEGWLIRSWATERLDGRDLPTVESDDDDKVEPVLSPQAQSSDPIQEEDQMRDSPPAPAVYEPPQQEQPQDHEQPQQEHHHQPNQRQPPSNPEDFQIMVPTQETFTFQSAHPFPHEEAMKLENLALSDAPRNRSVSASTSARNNRNRALRQNATRSLGRGAGQKRKVVDLAEFFRIDNFGPGGNDKDPFNQNSKRSRHT